MKTTKFKSVVRKVKSRGTCFIQIPKHLAKFFNEKEEIKVTINNKITFFCNIRVFRGLGLYVPADISLEYDLINKEVAIKLEKIDGFFTRILTDGRVYIPGEIAKNLGLKREEIILLECKTNEKILREYCKVLIREKESTTEYFCMFTKKHSEKIGGIFKILKVFPYKKITHSKKFFKEILDGTNFAEINNESTVIFYGNRVPTIINNKIQLEGISYYLGCFFADGTKRGNHWGICASTFEQARYYKEMHELLIHDAKIVHSISYSDPESKDREVLKGNLRELWQNNTGIILKNISVRILPTPYKNTPNRNLYGTLIFKENRELPRIYYVRLLRVLIDKIKKENNQQLALDFILGVLEGDGSVGPRKRGHLVIATNLIDSQILKRILDSTNLKFHIKKEGDNKYIIHIGSLEIIKNISILKDKLFKYYPKRRKLLKERLATTGCSRFLLGKNKRTSNWLIGQLNNYGILDGKGNLTKFGKKIQKDLKEFLENKNKKCK